MTGSPSLGASTPALLDRLTLQRVLVVAGLTFASALVLVLMVAADVVPVELVAAVPLAIATVGVVVLLARPVKTPPEPPTSEPTSGGDETASEAEVESIKGQVQPGEPEGGSIKAREPEGGSIKAPREPQGELQPIDPEVLRQAFESWRDEAPSLLSEPDREELARQVVDELDKRGYVWRAERRQLELIKESLAAAAAAASMERAAVSSSRGALQGAEEKLAVGGDVEGDDEAGRPSRVLSVGESLVGDGNEVAHIDLMIGPKDGPVGKAFAGALLNQKEGHTNLLALVAPNLPAKPDTIIANKVTIKGEKPVGHMFGPAQAAVARAVVDSVRDEVIPEREVEDLCVIVGVFIHWLAEDEKKIFDWNYVATKEAIARAMAGEPPGSTVLEQEAEARHAFAWGAEA